MKVYMKRTSPTTQRKALQATKYQHTESIKNSQDSTVKIWATENNRHSPKNIQRANKLMQKMFNEKKIWQRGGQHSGSTG